MTLVRVNGHRPKNRPKEHLLAFYETFEEWRPVSFDGFIITGAPIETLEYEEVTYWKELQRIFDWTTTNVPFDAERLLGRDGCDLPFPRCSKYPLKEKAFGVYRTRTCSLFGLSERLFRRFAVPVSR